MDAIINGSAGFPSPHCGRLAYSTTTALTFTPYNGDVIQIAGTWYRIPSAGIAGLASASSVYLNGTAAQTLAAATTYYVYAFVNSGVVTADFSTTGHATSSTSGNIGVEIKSGDNTRTLIGVIRTHPTLVQYVDSATQRFVSSWFNQKIIGVTLTVGSTRTETDAPWAELNTSDRIEFVCFAQTIRGSHVAQITHSGTVITYAALGIDGVSTLIGTTYATIPGATGATMGAAGHVALAAGYHYATKAAGTASGTATFPSSYNHINVEFRG